MRIFFLTLLMLTGWYGGAQAQRVLQVVSPIEHRNFTPVELKQFGNEFVDSLRIYNHAGEYRSTLMGISGVPLKLILKDIPLGEESPKVLSRYYIVCEAADGYAVVLSWNELFNTEVGDRVLVVTGIREGGDNTRFALISPLDRATGRRYVKQLDKISVFRINM